MVNVSIMIGLLDYNILLGCDYIYAMNSMKGHDYIYAMNSIVSSLFWVMLFPHEGCIITINKPSYCDPPSHTYQDMILSFVPSIKYMQYMSNSIKCV